MKIEVKFSCKDLVGGIRDGSYDISEGASVEDAITQIFEAAGEELTEGIRNSFVFLVGGSAAQWDTKLNEGEKLRILYRLLGG